MQYPAVQLRFQQNSVYTPLVDWTSELATTHSKMGTIVTELLEGETDVDEIPLMATTLDAMGVDSRARTFSYSNFAGKVQLNKKSNIFNQWKISGGNDWRPLLRGVLGNDVLSKHELLSRNIFLKGPKDRWTYAGSGNEDWGDLQTTDKFQLEQVIEWNFRLGNTGSPVIPGDAASAKVCIIPPGVTYAVRQSLKSASNNEAAMWRDAYIAGGQALRYEIGEFSGVRFVEAPSDRFGINPAVLYNCGPITAQYGVTEIIRMGDGAPDPDLEKVDEVWMVGQKNVRHYVQLESGADMAAFHKNDVVTIHIRRTSLYGVTDGVDPLAGRTIQRRIIKVDSDNKRLTFDRPVLFNYDVPFVGKSVSGAEGTYYAWVTLGLNIGMCLTLGSRGGVLGAVAEPLQFYEPVAIDDRQQIWRFVYDMTLGYNVWEPNLFEVHFCAVSIPKPGGVIG